VKSIQAKRKKTRLNLCYTQNNLVLLFLFIILDTQAEFREIRLRFNTQEGERNGGAGISLLHILKRAQGADPLPLPLLVAKTGRNHLNEDITPPPPHWDRRAI
jgi:hypothetical protein